MRAVTGGFLLVMAAMSMAFAHELGEAGRAGWWAWNFEPLAVTCLFEAWVWYGLGLWRARREVGLRLVTSRSRAAAFAAGLGILVIALLSPVDTLSDSLFWMHMVQHLLLTLVAPPLLVWSRPAVLFMWAFPRPSRKVIGRMWNGLGLGRAIHALLHPTCAWLLFTAVFLVWHTPGPFQYALDHEGVHELEHASFFVSALLFWSVVIAPSARQGLGDGARLLMLTTNGVLTGLAGAFMVLAPDALYPVQALRSVEWGLTGLEDQQIAGATMWVVGGFIYLAVGSLLFVRWLNADEPPHAAAVYRTAAIAPLLLLPLLLTGCNDRQPQQQMTGMIPMHGDARHGVQIIRDIGCGNCHTIPGIRGADGVVGPSLGGVGRRVFLAGVLRNTPANMILWLRTPQKVIPGNAMPDSGLSEKDARDVAVYLASLN